MVRRGKPKRKVQYVFTNRIPELSRVGCKHNVGDHFEKPRGDESIEEIADMWIRNVVSNKEALNKLPPNSFLREDDLIQSNYNQLSPRSLTWRRFRVYALKSFRRKTNKQTMENSLVSRETGEQNHFTEERITSCIHELRLSSITKEACSQSCILCVERFCWAMLADVLKGLISLVPKVLSPKTELNDQKTIEELLAEMGVVHDIEISTSDLKDVVEEVLDKEEQDKNCSLL
ncbi:DgyrCDS8321 [Dimorphilus gyrociliatus]|uniref:DgyrCDS8321 n=1 Tax=Dimorphilus gyrociliatus TaxID=2664684 RepID=A0A7I8VTS8_9ANNE|nr:DgyrCDS8321 [Dimorphilus gyrociliatus]